MTKARGVGWGLCCAVLGGLTISIATQVSAQTTPTIPTSRALTPLPFPATAPNPRTSAVKLVRTQIKRGLAVGELQGGVGCSTRNTWSFDDKLWETLGQPIIRIYRHELELAGYPVVRRGDSAFAQAAKPATADLDVGVTVMAVSGTVCTTETGDLKGQVGVRLRYEFFAPAAGKVVADLTTDGAYQFPENYRLTLDGYFAEAVRVSMRNLLADPRLLPWLSGVAALPPGIATVPPVGTTKPTAPVEGASSTPAPTAAAEAPQERRRVRGERPVNLPTTGNVPALRDAVATVHAGTRNGSGFYVTREGFLLTNQHVVGDSKTVRVKLVSGRELTGEVLRVDAVRDVALVKTEPVAFPVLPIRITDTQVGEDVYVLGSPLGDSFSGSLTRGILSGHRTIEGLRYIQSDATILPGSSGGPLLDGRSAVIGMTVKGVTARIGNISLFIPIADALAKLGLDVAP